MLEIRVQKGEKNLRAEKSPPKGRGELHFGGLAVFTRPFSGLLSDQTLHLLGSFAHREKAIGIRQGVARGAFWTALGHGLSGSIRNRQVIGSSPIVGSSKSLRIFHFAASPGSGFERIVNCVASPSIILLCLLPMATLTRA